MFTLPFNKETFDAEMRGRVFAIARQVLPSQKIFVYGNVWFEASYFAGAFGGKYKVENGHLILTDEWGKDAFVFSGLETKNGKVYVTGEPLKEADVRGFTRALMYDKIAVGENFNVCISSHSKYSEALIRILRSFERIGFPKDRLVVVVGDADAEKDEKDEKGWRIVSTTKNHDGNTALACLPEDMMASYWMLLHDTTEVTEDYASKDVQEIGLYSSSFIEKLKELNVFQTKKVNLTDAILAIASPSICLPDSVRLVATKDVYGGGVTRDVVYVDSIGVKKYRRAKGMAVKP